MAEGYLTEAQLAELQGLIGHRVAGIEECHWRGENEALLDYITLNFDNRASIVLQVGSTAENVDLIDHSELEAELDRRDRTMFVRTIVNDGPLWRRLLGNQIMDVEVKDEKGYAHSSIMFITANGLTEITTGVDVLEVVLP